VWWYGPNYQGFLVQGAVIRQQSDIKEVNQTDTTTITGTCKTHAFGKPFTMVPDLVQPANLSDSAQSSMDDSKKRAREREEDNCALTPEALAHMSRSERKRHREKKRRNDVNKGFDDLMELLIAIDPVSQAEHDERSKRGGPAEDHVLSRVELIGRTVEVLRRVHRENEERKLIIQQLLHKPVASAPTASLGTGLQTLNKVRTPSYDHIGTEYSLFHSLYLTCVLVSRAAKSDPYRLDFLVESLGCAD
jgi:hypothetical protein